MATRYIIQEDGSAHILLEDGTSALIKDGVAQSSDDVLIRIGPRISDTDMSGLVAPTFTAGGGGGGSSTVISPFYAMTQEWWEAA
jgi:hypothetical protein